MAKKQEEAVQPLQPDDVRLAAVEATWQAEQANVKTVVQEPPALLVGRCAICGLIPTRSFGGIVPVTTKCGTCGKVVEQ